MRAVRNRRAPKEAHPLIEPCRLGIPCAEPERVERASGSLDHLLHELSAHAEPPVVGEHVEVAHPADPWRGRIRIDVQAAHPDQSPIHQRGKQRLAGTIEPILAARPLIGESTHESVPGMLAIGHQRRKAIERQITQAFDRRRTSGQSLDELDVIVGEIHLAVERTRDLVLRQHADAKNAGAGVPGESLRVIEQRAADAETAVVGRTSRSLM